MSRTITSESVKTSSAARIAVLIPCHNEELTVAQVVNAFGNELPQARIYVFDNNSTDGTAERALAAGATLMSEPRQGKGFVVQSMFRRVDADVYVMVDGDGTYPGWANRLVLAVLNSMFRAKLTDILSGYRAFNRKFVKTLPVFGGGFEIETELTIKAVARGYRIVEIPTALTSRPAGSHSKIKFFRDGFLILNTILALFRDYKPLTFFGTTGAVLLLLSLIPGVAVALEFVKPHALVRPLLAIFAVGIFLCGLLSISVGLVLHSIARRSQEFDYQIQVLSDELRARNFSADHHE
ncbi:MAG: glycosyl transferase [Acidobacteria bacterium]|nr:MAG: glycosyl transferase [Acidobacteriota bacterium]